ncbi:MAG: amidohydrolase family protein, partial [Pirellulaceae bacterium]
TLMSSCRARWILPVDSRPIRNGLLTVKGDRIVAVGDGPSRSDTVDFGNAVLLPGLVNAHTHLEYSERESPIGQHGMAFVDWIAEVVAWKRARDADPAKGLRRRSQAVRRGLMECGRSGVTSVGEIATLPWTCEPYVASAGIDCVAFLEVIGLAKANENGLMDAVEQFVLAREDTHRGMDCGVSPHSPYSVNRDLLSHICEWSAKAKLPVAMHLAETAEELQLLATGEGPFVDLLLSLGAWDATAFSPGGRPTSYLERLARCHRALVIHGNFLDEDEIRFVAEHGDRMSIVYCPRTHAYFGHPRYPLAEMLAAGVNVALGTDSRASNPDLCLLKEMRYVAKTYPEIDWSDVIRMGTLAGAQALGIVGRAGSLTPGKNADFVAVRLPDDSASRPETLLEDDRCSVTHVCKSGLLIPRVS